MALPSSGPITMSEISVELGFPATQIISLNDAAVRTLAAVPAGVISLSDFYGKSNISPAGYALGGSGPTTPNRIFSIYEFNFPSETGSVIAATTPTGSLSTGAIGSTATDGYVLDFLPASPLPTARIFKFSFSTKTYSTAVPVTGSNIYSNSLNQNVQTPDVAFLLAGNPSGPAGGQYVRKITMPTQTVNYWQTPWRVLSPGASNVKNLFYSWTAWKNYDRGFIAGGFQSTTTASPYGVRLIYPTETASALPAVVYTTGTFPTMFPNFQGQAVGQSAENGYSYGGFGPGSTQVSTNIGRFVFATETANRDFQAMGVSPTGRANSIPFSTPTAVYWAGGILTTAPAGITPGATTTEIRKYTFATGTLSLVPTATIPARKGSNSNVQSAPVFG